MFNIVKKLEELNARVDAYGIAIVKEDHATTEAIRAEINAICEEIRVAFKELGA